MNDLSDDSSVSSTASANVSYNFDAADADVTFKSSDNVLFHVHRKNLETQAGGFPPSEFSTNGEIVELTEDAATLENLFEYVYPRRHPDLEDFPGDHVFKLAEAAEKYEVFGLMILCKWRIKQLIEKHPVEALNYAASHGYQELMSLAAPLTIDTPLKEVISLSPHFVLAWVRYRECWRAGMRAALKKRRRCPGCNSPTSVHSEFELDERWSVEAIRSLTVRCTNQYYHTTEPAIVPETLNQHLTTFPEFHTFL